MKAPTNTTALRPPLRLLQGRQAAAHTAPVQTPATPQPAPTQQHLVDLVHATWWSGHDSGERTHYTAGWRMGLWVGVFCGLLVGVPTGVAAAAAARWLANWVLL